MGIKKDASSLPTGKKNTNPGNFANRPAGEVRAAASRGGRNSHTGGFAAMTTARRKEIASQGGKASSGKFQKGCPAARAAGIKGALARKAKAAAARAARSAAEAAGACGAALSAASGVCALGAAGAVLSGSVAAAGTAATFAPASAGSVFVVVPTADFGAAVAGNTAPAPDEGEREGKGRGPRRRYATAASGLLILTFNIPPSYLISIGTVIQAITVGLAITIPLTGDSISAKQYGFEVIRGVGFGLTLSTVLTLGQLLVSKDDAGVDMTALTQIRVLGGTIALAICPAVLSNHLRASPAGVITPAELKQIAESLSVIDDLGPRAIGGSPSC
ncbi:hypothetical protein N0V88_007580 [Collariella sp. IMI 366227]|nr:hypothetical protein N0V88_007580 [Collariella sp. IMI 366227]